MKDKPVKLSTGQRLPTGQQRKPAMTRGERNVDAVALLKADHREVADLIEEFEEFEEADLELVNEADVEHASVRQLVAEIEGATSEDEHFDARFKVVGEYVRHHVQEEEKELFPKLEDADIDLDEMGVRLAARKAELMAQQSGETPAAH